MTATAPQPKTNAARSSRLWSVDAGDKELRSACLEGTEKYRQALEAAGVDPDKHPLWTTK